MSYESKFQGLARTYIPTLIKAGYSGRGALNWLSDQGLGYRRKEFGADWREFTGREAKKDVTKYIPKKYKPTAATMSVTSENLSGQYSYVYEIRGTDIKTGEPGTAYWRHASEELMTMEDVEDIIEEDTKKIEYEFELSDIYLVPSEVLSRVRL